MEKWGAMVVASIRHNDDNILTEGQIIPSVH